MPFTTLNEAVVPQRQASSAPSWIKEDFAELPTVALETLTSLWRGEANSVSQSASREAITELRNLVLSLRQQIHAQPSTTSASRAQSPSKKRVREDNDTINGHSGKQARTSEAQASVSGSWKGAHFEGVSFTIPQRKKLALTISPSPDEGILVTAAAGADTPEFGMPWNQVDNVLCLPVPEKTQPQKSFVVFPRGVDGLSESSTSSFEPIVFTVPDTKPKGAAEDEPTQAQAIKSAFAQSIKILEPDPDDFTSEIPPAGVKKGDKAYHIKAFRGSKDGFLFLLPTGIIWAFKKPLIFFSFSSIDSISYTSVLQRTFNLVISARPSSSSSSSTTTALSDTPPATDYEFSMLDQADFAGIDEYIKKNGLQDASLAEQRRAKVYNVNGKKGEDADAAENGTGEEGGELEKAQREADAVAAAKGDAAGNDTSDDEDDDENFDPGSDGESEGSGSDDDDDDDDGDEGNADADDVDMSDAEDKG